MNEDILTEDTDALIEMFIANVRMQPEKVSRWDNIVLSLIKDELYRRAACPARTRSASITTGSNMNAEHALDNIEFIEPGLQRAICQCDWKGPWREFISVAEHDILWHLRNLRTDQ